MLIHYQYITGEYVELRVEESVGKEIIELDRKEYNNNKKETRRHALLSAFNYMGEKFSYNEFEEDEQEEKYHILCLALKTLNQEQRDLIDQVYYKRKKIIDIARDNHVSHSAISQRLKTILKKLNRYFQKYPNIS